MRRVTTRNKMIQYMYHHGTLTGIWPGRSFRIEGQNPRKKGHIYLGKVIDRDKGIFWTRERGYYLQYNKSVFWCRCPRGYAVSLRRARQKKTRCVGHCRFWWWLLSSPTHQWHGIRSGPWHDWIPEQKLSPCACPTTPSNQAQTVIQNSGVGRVLPLFCTQRRILPVKDSA